MLDAGHYGDYNRSPAVPEYYESHMSWTLHQLLAAELEKFGIDTAFTRPARSGDLEVYTRGSKARGFDMFLSLHSNAVGGSVREDVDRPVVIRLANDGEGDAFARRLADSIADLMGTRQPGQVTTRLMNNGGEYYGVLRGARAAGCPHAFIVEHSFHTATAPSRWLLDPANLKALAVLEASLIAEFFGIEAPRKEDEPMTAQEKAELDALKSRITELESNNRIYHWYSELPDYARPTIERLHKSGVFSGAGPGDMQLSRDMMRILLILANSKVI